MCSKSRRLFHEKQKSPPVFYLRVQILGGFLLPPLDLAILVHFQSHAGGADGRQQQGPSDAASTFAAADAAGAADARRRPTLQVAAAQSSAEEEEEAVVEAPARSSLPLRIEPMLRPLLPSRPSGHSAVRQGANGGGRWEDMKCVSGLATRRSPTGSTPAPTLKFWFHGVTFVEPDPPLPARYTAIGPWDSFV